MILKANMSKTALVGGNYVQRLEDGSYLETKGTIVYRDGIITNILKDVVTSSQVKKMLGKDTFCIQLNESFYIYPGLIDLHNHIDYNLMPIWERPTNIEPWDNRHEWRHLNCREYQKRIKGLRSYITEQAQEKTYEIPNIDIMLQYLAEIQAISGGTTVLQEPTNLDDNNKLRSEHLLLRSTGVPTDLGLKNTQLINSIIDFYRPNIASDTKKEYYPHQMTSKWSLVPYKSAHATNTLIDDYISFLKVNSIEQIKNSTGGRIIHLAEGRAGNLLSGNSEADGRGMDCYSQYEFNDLKARLERIPNFIEKVAASKLTIIHGCGIDLKNPRNIEFINQCQIRLVWSPVSNLLLYEDTPNFINTGIDKKLVCLGSDWAPSGSKHIWDEGLFARQFALKHMCYGRREELNDRIFDMMTYNPAQALNPVCLGQIKEGCFADFYIVSKDKKMPNQVTLSDVHFTFNDAISMGTIINGNLVFGAEELFEMFENAYNIHIDRCNVKCSDKRNLKAYYPKELLSYFNIRKENNEIKIEDILDKLDGIFKTYSKKIGFSLVRSDFLSSEDKLYLNQITALKKKFC